MAIGQPDFNKWQCGILTTGMMVKIKGDFQHNLIMQKFYDYTEGIHG